MITWPFRLFLFAVLWTLVPTARGQTSPTAPAPSTGADVSAASTTTAQTQQAREATEVETVVDAAAIAQAQRRYGAEPTVDAVIRAAVRHQRLDPQRVTELASRARTSGWLPTLRLSARRGQTIDLLAAQSTTTDRNSASTGDDLVLEAQLMFDLSKLLWSNQELRVEREMRAERSAQQELTVLITALYFERRKLQLEADLQGPTIEGALRIAEIEGVLNALSAGVFTRARQEAQRSR